MFKLKRVCAYMKQIVNSKLIEQQSAKNRINVLRLELDYDLATLHEAINEKDEEKKEMCKKKIEKIRRELIKLSEL